MCKDQVGKHIMYTGFSSSFAAKYECKYDILTLSAPAEKRQITTENWSSYTLNYAILNTMHTQTS